MATPLFLWIYWLVAAGVLLGVPLRGRRWRGRGRGFGMFRWLMPALTVLGAVIIHARIRSLLPEPGQPALDLIFALSLLAAGLTQLAPSPRRGRMRGHAYRFGVSLPGQVFLAGALLSVPWILVTLPVRVGFWLLGLEPALDALHWADLTPMAVALGSLTTSTRIVPETVRVRLRKEGPEGDVERIPVERERGHVSPPLEGRTLRVAQIADPHIGPWQPVAKLRRHTELLSESNPDLVLLTGDYLTRESNGVKGALASALEPLSALPGRCFAIFGNHDHEAHDQVRSELQANGIRLLVNEQASADTPIGPVLVLGSDFVRGEGRADHIRELFSRYPRPDGQLRLFLLHDPTGFQDVPLGEADLTLSGHTHGGQVGLVSMGLPWTVLSRSSVPDHGLFGRGPNLLYVHRGTGFYGFSMRVGVPGEASILDISLD